VSCSSPSHESDGIGPQPAAALALAAGALPAGGVAGCPEGGDADGVCAGEGARSVMVRMKLAGFIQFIGFIMLATPLAAPPFPPVLAAFAALVMLVQVPGLSQAAGSSREKAMSTIPRCMLSPVRYRPLMDSSSWPAAACAKGAKLSRFRCPGRNRFRVWSAPSNDKAQEKLNADLVSSRIINSPDDRPGHLPQGLVAPIRHTCLRSGHSVRQSSSQNLHFEAVARVRRVPLPSSHQQSQNDPGQGSFHKIKAALAHANVQAWNRRRSDHRC